MAAQDIDSPGPPKRVLFVCCNNSERSQMAAAVLNAKYGRRFEALSAGIEPSGSVDERAVKVMNEIGLDISRNKSKSVDELIRPGVTFDYVITTCDKAQRECPYFPDAQQVHAGFNDPQPFYGTEDEKLVRMRAVRDQIVEWVDRFFGPRASLLQLEEQPVR